MSKGCFEQLRAELYMKFDTSLFLYTDIQLFINTPVDVIVVIKL